MKCQISNPNLKYFTQWRFCFWTLTFIWSRFSGRFYDEAGTAHMTLPVKTRAETIGCDKLRPNLRKSCRRFVEMSTAASLDQYLNEMTLLYEFRDVINRIDEIWKDYLIKWNVKCQKPKFKSNPKHTIRQTIKISFLNFDIPLTFGFWNLNLLFSVTPVLPRPVP